MKDVLDVDFITHYGRPDVLITDPPRVGMHTDVVETILLQNPIVLFMSAAIRLLKRAT